MVNPMSQVQGEGLAMKSYRHLISFSGCLGRTFLSDVPGIYARWLIPSLFASGLTQPLIRFYQSQSVTVPLFVCQLGALTIHVPLIYFLIWPAGFGFVGAAMSASIAW